MSMWRRMVNAVRGGKGGKAAATGARAAGGAGTADARPERGRIVIAGPHDISAPLTDELTAEKIYSILRTAASGDPARQAALFDRMLEQDEDLRNAERTRRAALQGIEWELLGADQMGNRSGLITEAAATPARDACGEMLDGLQGLDAALHHLSSAIGYGVAVVEVEWQGTPLRPAALHPIDHELVSVDSLDPRRLVIEWQDNRGGLILDEQPAGKFIVHAPQLIGGRAHRGGLMRPSCIGHLEKRWARRWEMIRLELFGVPYRTATYPRDMTDGDINRIVAMMNDYGAAGSGVFPEGAVFTVHESADKSGKDWPHEVIIARANAAYAKLWLGQTLTTEIGATGGAMAAATVHNEVRADLRDGDLRDEAATIRRDLLAPYVRYRLGEKAPPPYFRRAVEPPRDTAAELANLSTLVNDLGAVVTVGQAYAAAGISPPDGVEPDEPLPGRPAAVNPFAAGGTPSPRPSPFKGEGEAAAHSILRSVAAKRSPLGRTMGWVLAASAAAAAHTQIVLARVGPAIEAIHDPAQITHAVLQGFEADSMADLAALETELMLAGELAGRTEVAEKIEGRKKAKGKRRNRVPHSGRFPLPYGRGSVQSDPTKYLTAHAERGFAFEAIPFVEAVDALRARIGMDPDLFETLEAEARSRAWRVAGIYDMDLLAKIHAELTASIEAGETARSFRQRLPELAERWGWVGEEPWHAEIVHYQNFAMAHAAGRHRQYVEAGVQAWRFRTWGETCPICEPFDNRMFKLSDTKARPPLHFRCDCMDEPVFEGEYEAADLEDAARVEAPALAKEQARAGGFKWDVANYAALAPLELARFPEALRPAFREFGAARGWEIIE